MREIIPEEKGMGITRYPRFTEGVGQWLKYWILVFFSRSKKKGLGRTTPGKKKSSGKKINYPKSLFGAPQGKIKKTNHNPFW